MDATWISLANLAATVLLIGITAIYGKKFAEAKKAEIEAKQAEIAATRAEVAAKQTVIEGKDALIENLKREVESLKEINPETLRRYTLAIQEQLNAEIQLKEREKAKLLEELKAMKQNNAEQNSRIEELEQKLVDNETELNEAQILSSRVHKLDEMIDIQTSNIINNQSISCGETLFSKVLRANAEAIASALDYHLEKAINKNK